MKQFIIHSSIGFVHSIASLRNELDEFDIRYNGLFRTTQKVVDPRRGQGVVAKVCQADLEMRQADECFSDWIFEINSIMQVLPASANHLYTVVFGDAKPVVFSRDAARELTPVGLPLPPQRACTFIKFD